MIENKRLSEEEEQQAAAEREAEARLLAETDRQLAELEAQTIAGRWRDPGNPR